MEKTTSNEPALNKPTQETIEERFSSTWRDCFQAWRASERPSKIKPYLHSPEKIEELLAMIDEDHRQYTVRLEQIYTGDPKDWQDPIHQMYQHWEEKHLSWSTIDEEWNPADREYEIRKALSEGTTADLKYPELEDEIEKEEANPVTKAEDDLLDQILARYEHFETDELEKAFWKQRLAPNQTPFSEERFHTLIVDNTLREVLHLGMDSNDPYHLVLQQDPEVMSLLLKREEMPAEEMVAASKRVIHRLRPDIAPILCPNS